MSVTMVSYDPDRGISLRRESSKTFGGFELSLEDWVDVEPNEEYLERSIDDIYPAEKPTLYNINSNPSSDDKIPTNILLVEDNTGENVTIIPFFVKEEETSVEYRGRERFSVIQREPCEDRMYDESRVDLENGHEVASDEYTGKNDYYLYIWGSDDPVAYMPATYGEPSNIIALQDGNVWRSTKDIYFAPDSYLCELCGWADLYLEQTV